MFPHRYIVFPLSIIALSCAQTRPPATAPAATQSADRHFRPGLTVQTTGALNPHWMLTVRPDGSASLGHAANFPSGTSFPPGTFDYDAARNALQQADRAPPPSGTTYRIQIGVSPTDTQVFFTPDPYVIGDLFEQCRTAYQQGKALRPDPQLPDHWKLHAPTPSCAAWDAPVPTTQPTSPPTAK
jgi:hypothetical protein